MPMRRLIELKLFLQDRKRSGRVLVVSDAQFQSSIDIFFFFQ